MPATAPVTDPPTPSHGPSPTATARPSSTIRPSPTASPASSPTGLFGTFVEVLADDMSDPRSGFPTGDFEHQRVAYEDGALFLRLKSASRSTWSMRPFGDWPLVDVAATLTPLADGGEGFFGLTCGPSNDSFYAALLESGGGAVLLRVAAGSATALATDPAAAPAPTPGVELEIVLTCIGVEAGGATGARLSVGGAEVLVASDAGGFPSFERGGFYAESAAGGVGFAVSGDDIIVHAGLHAPPDPDASPSPTLPTLGDPTADALAAHVPESLRVSCVIATFADREATVAIDCPDGEVEQAAYLQYADETAMGDDYDALVDEHPEATGASCGVGPSEGPYTVDGVDVGRLVCFEEAGRARLIWTDDRFEIMGDAIWPDVSFDESYAWWFAAGPVP